ncbi:MAG: FAD:protein FMN transferase [Clostridia bacterium]|nr:FAD:protein FMN transferase [Clostridia bacterium]
MKRKTISKAALSLLLAFAILCSGCAAAKPVPSATATPAANQQQDAFQRFNRTDLSAFDTVITLVGFAADQASFDRAADKAFEIIQSLDHIFDGYNAYEDLHNLYYVNQHAAKEPVEIPEDLFRLITWCKEQWAADRRETNIAMGAVLSIWHEYRNTGILNPEKAQLPPMEKLTAASGHTDFDNVVLDAEKQTVFFSDPELTLDIGAVAKGYAADAVAALLYEDMPSFLLSLGGNVYAGNAPMDGRSNWAVGVQNPDISQNKPLDILDVHDKTVVTSGDYWRYYTVDGQRYHHIIDPETLMPSLKMVSVTILCESSILADFLSTALFVLPYEEGRAVADGLNGVEVMWVLPDGSIQATDGMRDYARNLKNPS